MAIKHYTHTIHFTSSQKRIIKFLKPIFGNEWDCKATEFKKHKKGLYSRRNEIKQSIKKQLKILQGDDCAFCGLNLSTRVTQIEHIAPKGKKLYPQFTFEKKNLILACSLCNGFAKKSIFDTIEVVDINYHQCEFNIVHPYFDNPNDHFEYLNDVIGLPCIIQIKNINGSLSTKGTKSNLLFELDSPAMTQERCKDILYQTFYLDKAAEALINEVKNNSYSN